MSNKHQDQLWEIDRIVRAAKPTAMVNGTRLVIEFISGFEKFNTRPYHNYETWGQGWRVTDPETGVSVESEDLDDAITAWLKQEEWNKTHSPLTSELPYSSSELPPSP